MVDLPEGTVAIHGNDVVLACANRDDAERAFDALEAASAPTPSLPEDAARVVERLATASDPQQIAAEIIALIQSLSSQLAEARAKGNDWSLEADKYKRALDRKVNEKIAEVQARKAAEADRARLAADLERKVAVAKEALEPFAEAGEAMLLTGGKNPKLSGPRMAEHLERARAALASLEDRA